MDLYLDFLESDDRSEAALADTRYRDKAFIRPALGGMEAATLTTDILRKWRDGIVKAAPRLRTRPGEAQRYREVRRAKTPNVHAGLPHGAFGPR